MTKKSFLERLRPRTNERGNMLVWYIFMMPVFLSAVGLAVDTSIMASTKSSLQTSLDSATQGTLALSKNQTDGGKPRMTTVEAQQSVIRLYDANRSGIYADRTNSEGIPFLKCQAGGNAPVSKCGFLIKEFKYSGSGNLAAGDYLTVTVQEKADTIFIQFLGFDDITYTMTSTSRLTNSYN